MNDMYLCTIVYEKTDERGLVKKTSESYLFDAVSHGDAEKRCVEELTPFIQGEYTIASVVRKKFAELFTNDKDYYFNAKVSLITIDEKSGAEKKQTQTVLVQANSIREVIATIEDNFKNVDYFLESVARTNILDYYPITDESNE